MNKKVNKPLNKEWNWKNKALWKRSAINTLHCLIGCNIGDFGVLIYCQAFYPELNFMYVMIMAMTAGICTSMTYEAIILKFRENFTWKLAYQTAFSMSILSMLGMEFSENITDYLLTKGDVPVSDPWFWGALAISMMVGFLLPWPYNYYKLAKYQKSCH